MSQLPTAESRIGSILSSDRSGEHVSRRGILHLRRAAHFNLGTRHNHPALCVRVLIRRVNGDFTRLSSSSDTPTGSGRIYDGSRLQGHAGVSGTRRLIAEVVVHGSVVVALMLPILPRTSLE